MVLVSNVIGFLPYSLVPTTQFIFVVVISGTVQQTDQIFRHFFT
jgi:hypothetical protein